ncbi:hypothetical protein JCM8547_001698 [Rhodosporidiobolus lusitaniae]
MDVYTAARTRDWQVGSNLAVGTEWDPDNPALLPRAGQQIAVSMFGGTVYNDAVRRKYNDACLLFPYHGKAHEGAKDIEFPGEARDVSRTMAMALFLSRWTNHVFTAKDIRHRFQSIERIIKREPYLLNVGPPVRGERLQVSGHPASAAPSAPPAPEPRVIPLTSPVFGALSDVHARFRTENGAPAPHLALHQFPDGTSRWHNSDTGEYLSLRHQRRADRAGLSSRGVGRYFAGCF